MPALVSALPDVGRAGSGGQQAGQSGVLAGADRAQVDVQAERPSRQGRCLAYGLINAGPCGIFCARGARPD